MCSASQPCSRPMTDAMRSARHFWWMKNSLSPANFETWLRDTQLVDVDEQRFRIAVPNGFAKDWLAIAAPTDGDARRVRFQYTGGARSGIRQAVPGREPSDARPPDLPGPADGRPGQEPHLRGRRRRRREI